MESTNQGVSYAKLEGLKTLSDLGLRVPNHIILRIYEENSQEENMSSIMNQVSRYPIPNQPGDRVGITIRISLPTFPDRGISFAGIHETDSKEISEKVWRLYQESDGRGRIFMMDTVDAEFSGTILKTSDGIYSDVIKGDLPNLVNGKSKKIESWKWNKKWENMTNNKSVHILSNEDLNKLQSIIEKLPNNTYVEWSKSKKGTWFFYEYITLQETLNVS